LAEFFDGGGGVGIGGNLARNSWVIG